MKYSVYGVNVENANEHHYAQKIAELLYGYSAYGAVGAGKKDIRGTAYNKMARIAVKALREAAKK